jgi:hypothetical protein
VCSSRPLRCRSRGRPPERRLCDCHIVICVAASARKAFALPRTRKSSCSRAAKRSQPHLPVSDGGSPSRRCDLAVLGTQVLHRAQAPATCAVIPPGHIPAPLPKDVGRGRTSGQRVRSSINQEAPAAKIQSGRRLVISILRVARERAPGQFLAHAPRALLDVAIRGRR